MTPGLAHLMQAIGNLFREFQHLSPATRSFLEWGTLAAAASLIVRFARTWDGCDVLSVEVNIAAAQLQALLLI